LLVFILVIGIQNEHKCLCDDVADNATVRAFEKFWKPTDACEV
jgi:hypothetical protein